VSTQEEVIGGRVNRVVRVGSTVRRRTGAWTPAVHALFEHLAAIGFAGAPRALGIDEAGREILDYLPGDVPSFPWPEQSDEGLAAVGRLVRRYHDATTGFVPPEGATWYLPPVEPVEVICHGDLAPDNCVFRDGAAVALIDFDVAHPGPRVWDLGYAACCFVPLRPPIEEEPAEFLHRQGRRLGILCDGYGLEGPDRAAVVDNASARLSHLADHIEEQAALGQEAFVASLAAGHPAMLRASAGYIDRNGAALKAAVSGSSQ
jgi:hypothetical protein